MSHSSFVVFNDDHTSGVIVAEYPPSVGAVGTQITTDGITQDDLIAGGRKVLEVSDAADLADGPVRDILRRLGVRSVLVVPVHGKTGLLGAFSADVIEEQRQFSDYDRQFCQIFASQLAVALENARGAQQQANDRLRLLAEAEHSLKTPLLQAIRKAQSALAQEQPSRDDLVVIRALCTKMYAQLSTLRVFARSAAGEEVAAKLVQLSVTEVVAIVRTAVEDAEALSRPNHRNRFVLEVQPGRDLFVDADVSLLDIAIRNVLDNAVKYSYPDTDVRIAIRTSKSLEINIRSRGLRLRPDELDHVFKRGWRSSSAMAVSGGSGIGLWLVSVAMKVLNGDVSIEPHEDTFTVSLCLPVVTA